ncbi:MAG: hypothetical protein FJZ01_04675 [Candidatus Sericytochromatia bacterium]|nr:hypothetical protein [Candidatus Tanganyikabacteria bacterium]
MRGLIVTTAALAGASSLVWSLPAGAQVMERSQETIRVPVAEVATPIGPTRMWSVNSAVTLPEGVSLLGFDLRLGATGLAPVFAGAPGVALGVIGTGLNVRADAAVTDGFEIGAGVGASATAPWRGRLDLHGKWNLMREGVEGAWLTLGTLAGGQLEMDANGVPNLGLQVGMPITKVFPFTNIQYAAFTIQPNWNLGLAGSAPGLAGIGGFNFLGLGVGLDLAMTERTHFLADTNFGLKVGGVTTDSALGLRYAFNRNVVGSIYLGVGAAGPGAGISGLGIGGTWRM